MYTVCRTCQQCRRAPSDPAAVQSCAWWLCPLRRSHQPDSLSEPRHVSPSTPGPPGTPASSVGGQSAATPSEPRRWETPSPAGRCTAVSVLSGCALHSRQISRSPVHINMTPHVMHLHSASNAYWLTTGVLVAQTLRRWTSNLAVVGSIPGRGIIRAPRSTQPFIPPG